MEKQIKNKLLNYTWFIAKKIAFGKGNKKNLSQIIIKIGQCTVAIGIIVSVLTIAIGLGSKKAIKKKLSDFNGHITIKSFDSNNSYNSSILNSSNIDFQGLQNIKEISHIQKYATKSGIIRTETNFEGVIMKGVSSDFSPDYFEDFIIKGEIPKYSQKKLSFDVIISDKIAKELFLDVDSSFVMYFLKDKSNPIYRRFFIKGIYKTDIKIIDESFIIGDIKQIQRLNAWDSTQIGGINIFLKDVEKIDPVYTKIKDGGFEGYNNVAEKATTTYSQINTWIELFNTNIYIILGIMLTVVLINVIMVLLILIIERTPSIGMLKTIGAGNNSIRMIFIYYTIFIMIPGLIIGNIISLILLFAQKYFGIFKLNPDDYLVNEVPVYINFFYIFIISLALIIISILVLLFPSYLISKISPIKTIKFN